MNERLFFSICITISIILAIYLNREYFPCHRKEERCYKFMRNYKNRICSRCFSMIIGLCLLPIIVQINPKGVYLLILGISLQLPMLIDGITQAKKKRTSNNFLRTITGLISGIGLALIIYFLGFSIII